MTDASQSQKRRAPNSSRRRSSPIFGDTILSKVAQVLIGAAATFLVIDLLLKQNVQAYLTEQREIQAAISIADQEFSSLQVDIQNLFFERIYAARNMNELAAYNNINRFVEYYQQYYRTVEEWNLNKGEVLSRIRSYTKCDEISDESTIGKSIRNDLLDPYWGINRSNKYAGVLKVTPVEFYDRTINERYCPDVMLFSVRGDDPSRYKDSFQSAFEELRYMHQLFAESTRRDVVACSSAAKAVLDRRVAACDAHTFRIFGETYFIGAESCIRYVLYAYSPTKLCPDPWYRDLADIKPQRFQAVEYRIAVSLSMLDYYRVGYVTQACEAKRGFWSRLFNVDCDKLSRAAAGQLPAAPVAGSLASLQG